MGYMLEAKRIKIETGTGKGTGMESSPKTEEVKEKDTNESYFVIVDSDDDDVEYDEIIHIPPPRPATKAELDEYYRQTFNSEGFDVERFEGTISGGIGPCRIDETNEQLLINFSKLALQTYNGNNGASFEFDHLIKANQQAVAGFMYYITFAAHSGDTTQTFRGKVWRKLYDWGSEVKFCKMI